MKKIFFLMISICLAISVIAQTNVDVFKSKNIKSTMLKAAEWQIKNPKHPSYDWTNGAFYAGLFA
ncbi:MAG: glycoside hydrolase family 88 protein, partial [Prevotellaceae bacterium]|nr:glycoside hydrolase family 88 protein [Prevotellaceae bacterium]